MGELQRLRNVGPATEGDLLRLGITRVEQLVGLDAFALYDRLCAVTGVRHDPCVIDVFLSAVDQAQGGEPKAWWAYTAERKRRLAPPPAR
ncbi:MAG: mitomycin resistance protein [Myxococcales bacterium]|nr:mitomycin resistance protein [Myxococcales bacterium]